MFKFRNDTRFIEYLQAAEGQYSIKVEHKVETKNEDRINRRWLTIGYITKKYSKADNKYIYIATDSTGNQIYSNIKELHLLKQEFKSNGKNLADNAQIAKLEQKRKTNKAERIVNIPKDQRSKDLENVRENKNEKHKSHEVSKQDQKTKNLRTEKELDAINEEKSKETKSTKTESHSIEHTNDSTTNTENSTQPVEEHDIVNDRMDELNDIREQDNDIEQDMEIEM